MYAISVALSLVGAGFMLFFRSDVWSGLAYIILWPLVLLRMPRFIYNRGKAYLTPYWLQYMEWLFFLTIAINIPGTAYFHTIAYTLQYDRLLHFACGWLGLPFMVCLTLAATGSHRRTIRLLPLLFLIGVVLLFAWEGFQYATDHLLGTVMFYDEGQNIVTDFWEDIILGFIGLCAAIPYVRNILADPNRFIRAKP